MDSSSDFYVICLCTLTTLLIVGGVANVTVIVLVWKQKSLRSFTNYFLVNLAVADLFTLVCITACTTALFIVDSLGIRRNHSICSFEKFEENDLKNDFRVAELWLFFKSVSDLTVMCLAIGRYTALVKTLVSVKTILQSKSSLVMVWCVPLSAGIIKCTIWETYFQTNSEHVEVVGEIFVIISVFFFLVIPGATIVYCYSCIIKGIYFDKTILGEGVESGASSNLHSRIIVRLLIITVITVLSTITAVVLPIYIIFNKCVYPKFTIKILFVLTLLQQAVAAINPVIYSLLNFSFRRAILRFTRKVKRRSSEAGV